MTFKKIFAFTLALLLIIGSAFAVSAETPPYSEGFERESEMFTALFKYAEEYPDNVGLNLSGNIPTGYHLEYRQIISMDIKVDSLVPKYYSFAESRYGQGVDYTFTSFDYENGTPGVLRAFVYYGYNTDEVLARLENAKAKEGVSTFDEGVVDGKPYVICKSCVDCDPPRIDYYLAMNEYLIHIISIDPDIEDLLSKVKTQCTDVCIPVKIKDNADWFDKTIENGYVVGDANSDGELNIKDATAVQKYLAKFGKVDKLVADFNGDLEINVKDATDIQKRIAGLDYTCRREKYPVTFSHRNNTEEKLFESVSYSSGPLSHGELDLIIDGDVPDITHYTTVFNSAEEIEAFFGKSLERFDEDFFETKSLVYLYRFYGSCSQTIIPEHLQYADGILHVWCGYSEPGVDEEWLDAWGNYNLYFEVNKEDIKDLRGIKVSEVMVVYD